MRLLLNLIVAVLLGIGAAVGAYKLGLSDTGAYIATFIGAVVALVSLALLPLPLEEQSK